MQPRKLVIAPLAHDDLRGILHHIAQDNPHAVRLQVTRLIKVCERVGANPFCGEKCPEFSRSEYRRLHEKNYVIFYQFDDKRVDILRVLHGARDWTQIL